MAASPNSPPPTQDSVPAVTLDGGSDTLKPRSTADQPATATAMFTGHHEHRVIDTVITSRRRRPRRLRGRDADG
jgi:hypothetical protein